MDVWTLTPVSCQVDVVDADMEALQKFCNQNDIAFNVVIQDLEKAIKEHMKEDAPTALRYEFLSRTIKLLLRAVPKTCTVSHGRCWIIC